MPSAVLRDLGVYLLPDGREIVATECVRGEYCLFHAETWERFGLGEYFVDAGGRVLRGGEPAGWHAADLADTGRTARRHVLGAGSP